MTLSCSAHHVRLRWQFKIPSIQCCGELLENHALKLHGNGTFLRKAQKLFLSLLIGKNCYFQDTAACLSSFPKKYLFPVSYVSCLFRNNACVHVLLNRSLYKFRRRWFFFSYTFMRFLVKESVDLQCS